jgi:hypothetical protein
LALEIPSYTGCAVNVGNADKNCLPHDAVGTYKILATLNN